MLNQKDLAIMSCLRKDSRMKLTKMSRLTKLPVSTIFDRIKFHEGGLIKSHICIIDFSKLGFHARANVMFSVAPEQKNDFRSFIESNEHVNTIYKINNGFDFLAEIVFKNIVEMDSFLDMVEHKFAIRKKEVHYIIDEIKREAFLSEADTAPLLEST